MDPHGPTPATSNDGSSGGSSPASPSGSPAPAVGAAMVTGGNVFANDGSFMEMFKKMEEEKKKKKEKEQTGGDTEKGQTSASQRKPPPVTSFVRGLPVVRRDR